MAQLSCLRICFANVRVVGLCSICWRSTMASEAWYVLPGVRGCT